MYARTLLLTALPWMTSVMSGFVIREQAVAFRILFPRMEIPVMTGPCARKMTPVIMAYAVVLQKIAVRLMISATWVSVIRVRVTVTRIPFPRMEIPVRMIYFVH